MSQTCPNCGAVNRATNRFCSRCGARLTPADDSGQTQPIAPAEATTPSKPSTEVNTGTQAVPEGPINYRVQRWDSEPPSTGSAESSYVSSIPTPPPPPYPGYQGYSPATSGRKEGATYTPYSTDVARSLERQGPQRSWLWPVVVVAALVLLATAAVSVYIVLNKGVNLQPAVSSPLSASSSPTPLPANASEEEKVKAVIIRSNQEQIQAWHTLDTSILSGTRTGAVLSENIQTVNDLKRNNMYAIPVNQTLDIKDIKVNGNTAVAHTFEVWTVTYYTSDGQQISAMGPDSLTETYYLVKQNGRWLINRLDIYGQGTPTPQGQ